VLSGSGHMSVDVEISLLSCVQAEICATEFSKPPSWISDLLAAYYHCYNTSGVTAYEYSGIVVRISFLANVEQKIYHAFAFSLFLFTTSGVEPYWLTGDW